MWPCKCHFWACKTIWPDLVKHVFNFKMQVVPLTSHTLKFKDMFTCFAGWKPQCSATSRVECISPTAAVSQLEYLIFFDSKLSKAEAVSVHLQRSGASVLSAGVKTVTFIDKAANLVVNKKSTYRHWNPGLNCQSCWAINILINSRTQECFVFQKIRLLTSLLKKYFEPQFWDSKLFAFCVLNVLLYSVRCHCN